MKWPYTTAVALRPVRSTGAPVESGDRRSHAVGPDHDGRLDAGGASVSAGEHGARDPAARVADEVDGGDAVDDLRPRGRRRAHEQRVEHGAPRRVEGVDPVARLDGHRDLLVGVVEGRRPDRRRPRGLDLAEEAPAVKLQHGAAHEGVRRERVIPEPAAIDGQDAQAGAGEEHRRRRSGGAGTDDDRVVSRSQAGFGLHGRLSRSVRRPVARSGGGRGGPRSRGRRRRRRRSSSTCAGGGTAGPVRTGPAPT